MGVIEKNHFIPISEPIKCSYAPSGSVGPTRTLNWLIMDDYVGFSKKNNPDTPISYGLIP